MCSILYNTLLAFCVLTSSSSDCVLFHHNFDNIFLYYFDRLLQSVLLLSFNNESFLYALHSHRSRSLICLGWSPAVFMNWPYTQQAFSVIEERDKNSSSELLLVWKQRAGRTKWCVSPKVKRCLMEMYRSDPGTLKELFYKHFLLVIFQYLWFDFDC